MAWVVRAARQPGNIVRTMVTLVILALALSRIGCLPPVHTALLVSSFPAIADFARTPSNLPYFFGAGLALSTPGLAAI